jgi:RNA polymerase sigma-70 factor (ECF subfamily)
VDAADDQAQFVQLLTAAQPRLFGYIAALLGDVHEANNVLQETNLVLWTKSREFRPGTSFFAWAREIAYFKALSYYRDAKREPLIVDHSLVEGVFARSDALDPDERRAALRHCLAQLDERQQSLLRHRYADGASMVDLAQRQNKSIGAVKMSLKRLRVALLGCIERRMRAAS